MSLERRDLSGGAFALVSTSLENIGFLAAFTERTGGVSDEERFASLNLSYSSGDDAKKVGENRARVITALRTGPFTVGGQVHGAALAEVGPDRAGRGFEGPDGVIPDTDGLHTTDARVPLAVATADCVPVILASADAGRIAVIHAGWRGVAAGIIQGAASLFSDPTDIHAAIGPSAGGCCYEVGEEVVAAVEGGCAGEVASERRGGSLYLDLSRTIANSLRALRIRGVETSDACTIHESSRFFSHRRQGPSGRQFAIAMRHAG